MRPSGRQEPGAPQRDPVEVGVEIVPERDHRAGACSPVGEPALERDPPAEGGASGVHELQLERFAAGAPPEVEGSGDEQRQIGGQRPPDELRQEERREERHRDEGERRRQPGRREEAHLGAGTCWRTFSIVSSAVTPSIWRSGASWTRWRSTALARRFTSSGIT